MSYEENRQIRKRQRFTDDAPTNMEMYHYLQRMRQEREARIERDGCCCDEGPWEDGHCSQGRGRCPLYEEALRIMGKHL